METPQPGSTMLPYLNFARGLRMDYASSWMVQEQATPSSFAVQFVAPQTTGADTFQENLVLQVQPVFPESTLASLLQVWQTTAQQAQLQVLEMTMSSLAGLPAARAVFLTRLATPMPLQGKVLSILFLQHAMAYSAVYTARQDHFEAVWPTVSAMLATLQVLSTESGG